ncbi:MAG: PEP-CTERM sorting domain-containing protein [Actinomycetota bacterium]
MAGSCSNQFVKRVAKHWGLSIAVTTSLCTLISVMEASKVQAFEMNLANKDSLNLVAKEQNYSFKDVEKYLAPAGARVESVPEPTTLAGTTLMVAGLLRKKLQKKLAHEQD